MEQSDWSECYNHDTDTNKPYSLKFHQLKFFANFATCTC